MDINRLVQNAIIDLVKQAEESTDATSAKNKHFVGFSPSDFGAPALSDLLKAISKAVSIQTEKIHKYLTAFNQIVLDMRDNHMITIYDAGFIAPEKQYLTVGINGLVEGAECLGIKISDNDEYAAYVNAIMEPIFEANKAAKTETIMFNTEMVPAENLGILNAPFISDDKSKPL